MAELKQASGSKNMFATYAAILIPLGAAINYIGSTINTALNLPFFLDSIGTAIVAAIMGPWVGAAAGLLFSVVSAIIGGNIMSSLFGICEIATGLIVGYYVRAGKFNNWKSMAWCTWWVIISNTIIGSAVAAYVFGGISGGGGFNVLVGIALAAVKDTFSAQFITSLPANIIDKGLAIIIAWLILRRLPASMKTLSGAKLETAPDAETK